MDLSIIESSADISISDLSDDDQDVIARGLISIILANKIVNTSEISYLKTHCNRFMGDDSVITIERLENYIKNRDQPDFFVLQTTDAVKIDFILKIFVRGIYSDQKKMQSETEVYFNIGQKMGVSFYILSEILQIEASRNQINQRENHMLDEFKEILENEKGKNKSKNKKSIK